MLNEGVDIDRARFKNYVLDPMLSDDVTRTVTSDELILAFGRHLYGKNKSVQATQYIRLYY